MSVWEAVERLVDEATDAAAIEAHGLHLVAARRWRRDGRPVPATWVAAERNAALATLAAPSLLARVRGMLPGQLLVLKGPEAAARYPDPALRSMGDLDLLVPDAVAAERTLRAAGWVPAEQGGTVARPQHRPPLRWPTSPLPIELHHELPVPPWATTPPPSAVIATAVRSAVPVDGLSSLPPSSHALLLAAHAWLHYGPRPRVRDLIDVAVMAEGLDPDEQGRLARTWGLDRVWTFTMRALVALDALPGRDLREVSLGGEHLARWAGALWAPSGRKVPLALVQTVGRDLRPWPGEGWPARLGRLRRAGRHALTPAATYRSDDR